jgi:putative transport protein
VGARTKLDGAAPRPPEPHLGHTLIAVLLSLAIRYDVGSVSYRGFSLGVVTATLIAAVVTGQVGITILPNVMSILFLMFLFAVGYGVGPQFVCSIVSDGLPQALFAAINCV